MHSSVLFYVLARLSPPQFLLYALECSFLSTYPSHHLPSSLLSVLLVL